MKVKEILERVTTLYNDKEYVRVPKSHYLRFLDDAINQLILSRPDSHVKTEIVKLVPGTRQDLPAGGYTLIDIYMTKKKLADDVFENYRPVYQVERKDLDYFENWHSGTITGVDYINEFAYDTRSPLTFWVTPFVGTQDVYVEMDYSYGNIKYSEFPNQDLALEEEIPISEVFMGPLISYMLFLLYSTDSTSAVDREVAQRYEAVFYQALGLEYNAVQIVVPKVGDEVSAGQVG